MPRSAILSMLKVMFEYLLIPSWSEILITITRTTGIFFYTFLLLRFLGKKQISQFTWFDILLIVALGSAVGDTMIYPEHTVPVVISMTAIFIVILMVKAISFLMIQIPRVEDVIEGTEYILVEKGKIQQESLRKSDMTEREMLDWSKLLSGLGISVVKKSRSAT